MSSNKLKKILRPILYRMTFTRKLCEMRIHFFEWKAIVYPYWKTKLFHPHTVFFVLTPEHGNLGDHAIAIAGKRFLQKANISYYEITCEQLRVLQNMNYLHIMNGRTIVVNGGGNLGTLWFSVEELFRNIITQNPKSKIILMPNTFFYENSDFGRFEHDRSIKIYNSHSMLYLFAREAISYKKMKDIYIHVESVPDMVLSLYFPDPGYRREGCLLCLRNDREKIISKVEENSIMKYVKFYFGESYKQTDMIDGNRISIVDREITVLKKIDQFQHAKIVITDRLHAMIFCAISETPCIVVNSMSPKVKGTYDIIRNLPYIQFIDNINDLGKAINKLININECKYDNSRFISEYDKLTQILQERKHTCHRLL